jgi:ATP-dependent Clp protease ATP-binding subunit ClpC
VNWLKSFWKALSTPQRGTGQADGWPEKNFTPRVRQVLGLAHREAERLHHDCIGTEHVLLGLIRLGQGKAITVLQKKGIELERVRATVEKVIGAGPVEKTWGRIAYTPRVKRVLALAIKRARAFGHNYVGTEHLLLGLLDDGGGLAFRVLQKFNVNAEETRQLVLTELSANATSSSPPDAGRS